MAVSTGTKVYASDYNILRTAVNRWFADNYAGSISFGDGNQTYGWGGTPVSTVTQGNTMLADEMNAIIDRCNIGVDICNSVTGNISRVEAGVDGIDADQFNDSETRSNSIVTNRNNIDAAEMSLLTGGSSARSIAWSSQITCTFRYTFADFDEARYFFNSGGALTVSGTITGYSTGWPYDGAGFNEIFTTMGTIFMDYTQTTQSGSGGSTTGFGYYDLTTSFVTIFTQTGTGAYSDSYFGVQARRSTLGEWIELRVYMTPDSGKTVNGTTTITTQMRKLDAQTSGSASLTITSPSYSLITGL